ncbi:MAG TPA: phosphate acyltransferase PlsX [Thermohalobaculum sp.]|nr:phosphate acyltransferase PlsX [Thermohalobaculum sp.]
MSGSTVISIDAMGGDKGPEPVLDGLQLALEEEPGLRFIVHGDKAALAPLLEKRPRLAEACEVRHAPGVIRMEDKPARALREGRDSSMWHALKTVAAGDATVAVSPGNTGALMAMAMFVLRRAPGVDRPAIAVQWPAANPHGYNIVLDMGADIRADAENLLQYAIMGAEYAQLNFNLARPRVGILNVGSEETKGPEELRTAAGLIRRAVEQSDYDFEYIGFVEGNDLLTAKADVIVTDGFTGNVALKAGEGTASFIRTALQNAFRHSVWSQLGTLFAMTSLKRLKARIDPRRANGGVFLGLNGAVVKSHGGTDALGFCSAVTLGAKMAAKNFSTHVAEQVARLEVHEEAGARTGPPAAGKGGT